MPSAKQKRLSLEDKVKVLKRLDSGVNGNRVASDFGVSASAISQIKNKKYKLLRQCRIYFKKARKNITQGRIRRTRRKVIPMVFESERKKLPNKWATVKSKSQESFFEFVSRKKRK